ncbi:GNAT family N-acetyltransferase [Aspergillus saccharolyticus JOP 1030-1]|uniref:Putative GNAT family N-acetyltransferase n=1 Tax=Aspergillus saccharolyticus JOP 1030-1 TaxID=1450539 RepID=A0A318Z1H5_9EURO|nr:putative GNAT family N-acetyltransferase [Aspergillus saccharolyticus JOP 1030-1]PYH40234.1 putative GNAT family N-acetyltransferase [Aspergillus saccharolyticus JOP 1030-1]
MANPTLPPNYTLHLASYPPVKDYLHLRAASGLTPKNAAQATAAIQGSWYGCYVTYDGPNSSDDTVPADTPYQNQPESNRKEVKGEGEVVGMGRIIGDGGWYFHIADMAVLPAHQRKGLGGVVLAALLQRIREAAPEGEPYVNLLADAPGRRLYAKYGFVESAPKELGMGMVIRGR